MRSIINIIFVACLSPIAVFAQSGNENKNTPVKWYSFEDAVEKSKTQKRKLFVDVYTDWCGWCKVMDAKTFSDPKIAKLLNEKYYPVKLNAEQRADIAFNGQVFKFIPQGKGGVHQLAAALLDNQMSYPNFVFLDEDFRIVRIYSDLNSVPGFHKAEEFYVYLDFVGSDNYRTKNIDQYKNQEYKSPYAATAATPR